MAQYYFQQWQLQNLRQQRADMIRAARMHMLNQRKWRPVAISEDCDEKCRGRLIAMQIEELSKYVPPTPAREKWSFARMMRHVYVSGSFCWVAGCGSLMFQDGRFTLGVTAGLTVDNLKPGVKSLIPGTMGGGFGVSAGIVTAEPEDQAMQLGSITVAEGLIGGSYGFGRDTSGGTYHQFGYAAGTGINMQGPTNLLSFYFNPFSGEYNYCTGNGLECVKK
ncbi:hypothetical protein ACT1U9_11025 [Streptomyces sp. BR1]|uniref:hypothetical protein n=1 Tax=Streptomyces sp. BR1 TaxID=1592323 RepID=UPI00402B936F